MFRKLDVKKYLIEQKTITQAVKKASRHVEAIDDIDFTTLELRKTYIRKKGKTFDLYNTGTWDTENVGRIESVFKKMGKEVQIVAVVTEESIQSNGKADGYIMTTEEYAMVLKKRLIEYFEYYKGKLCTKRTCSFSGNQNNNSSSAYIIYTAYSKRKHSDTRKMTRPTTNTLSDMRPATEKRRAHGDAWKMTGPAMNTLSDMRPETEKRRAHGDAWKMTGPATNTLSDMRPETEKRRVHGDAWKMTGPATEKRRAHGDAWKMTGPATNTLSDMRPETEKRRVHGDAWKMTGPATEKRRAHGDAWKMTGPATEKRRAQGDAWKMTGAATEKRRAWKMTGPATEKRRAQGVAWKMTGPATEKRSAQGGAWKMTGPATEKRRPRAHREPATDTFDDMGKMTRTTTKQSRLSWNDAVKRTQRVWESTWSTNETMYTYTDSHDSEEEWSLSNTASYTHMCTDSHDSEGEYSQSDHEWSA